MFVPAMLPSASVPSSCSADWTPMASSGVLVPRETTVTPTTIGGMPNLAASRDPPRTSSSAPVINAARPSTIRTHAFTRPPAHSRADDLTQRFARRVPAALVRG